MYFSPCPTRSSANVFDALTNSEPQWNPCTSPSPKLAPQGHPLTASACWRQLFGISVPGKYFTLYELLSVGPVLSSVEIGQLFTALLGRMHWKRRLLSRLSDHLSVAIDNLQWGNFSIYPFCCQCSFLPKVASLNKPLHRRGVMSASHLMCLCCCYSKRTYAEGPQDHWCTEGGELQHLSAAGIGFAINNWKIRYLHASKYRPPKREKW